MTSILDLLGIHKRFGPVHALRGVDFFLHAGEIHALLGENGAGKSTLMHVAYGLTRPDSGEIRIGGTPQRISTARTARRLGIGMVHQHFTSVPALTVAENVALAAGWRVVPQEIRERTRSLSDSLGLPLDSDQRAANLRGGLRLRRGPSNTLVRPDGPALVVVDDLVTTGASLTEAVRCLDTAGYEVLGAATVSATVRRLSGY